MSSEPKLTKLEYIATQILCGMLAKSDQSVSNYQQRARFAIEQAKALMQEIESDNKV